jgi:uncharacterized cupin superfamily protein
MKKVSALVLCCAFALVVFISVGAKVTAQNATSPVRLDRDKIAGLGLTAIPPDSYKDILVGGQLNMKVATLFSGKELNVSIFECTPAKTDHRTRPNESDEFVYVLSGKLILTEPNGTVHQYQSGDSLVLPAGYTGTWEMQGNYREIAITAKKAPQQR